MKKELKNLIDTIKKSGEDLRTKCEDLNFIVERMQHLGTRFPANMTVITANPVLTGITLILKNTLPIQKESMIMAKLDYGPIPTISAVNYTISLAF